MPDEISYPLSAQSLPVPLYVVLEGRIVFANAAGVCMVRALSSDQLLGEPFSRFFQDIPAWLEARTGEDADATQPDARAIPAAQLVSALSAGDSNEVVSVRLTVTPTRFDGLPAQQVVVHGLPLPLDAQLPGKAGERVLSAEAIGAALPHEHLDHLLSTLPSAASLGERLHAALRALEAALPSALCVVVRVVSGRARLYGTQRARAKLALRDDHAAHLPTAAQGEFDIELARIAPLLNELAQILFRYEAPALADAANGALRRDAEH